MKRIACMLVLGCGGCGFVYGQTGQPAPAPSPAPDQGRWFYLPAPNADGKPHFKLQIPGKGQMLMIPRGVPQVPHEQAPGDPGIVRRPHGFAQHEGRPASPHNIYPDLKVMPTEVAQVDAPASPARLEAIPRVFPHAKVEPIPITWMGYRVVPVAAEDTVKK